MYINKDDSYGSAILGDTAEALFIHHASKKGYTVSEASTYQNINEHWDFKLTNSKGVSKKFDVKGLKRLHRKAEPSDDNIYIELFNVQGRPGWISGEADFIAILLSDGFYIVLRKDLKELAKKLNLDDTVYDSVKNKEHYKLYSRRQWNKKDVFMLITKKDLCSIKYFKWVV